MRSPWVVLLTKFQQPKLSHPLYAACWWLLNHSLQPRNLPWVSDSCIQFSAGISTWISHRYLKLNMSEHSAHFPSHQLCFHHSWVSLCESSTSCPWLFSIFADFSSQIFLGSSPTSFSQLTTKRLLMASFKSTLHGVTQINYFKSKYGHNTLQPSSFSPEFSPNSSMRDIRLTMRHLMLCQHFFPRLKLSRVDQCCFISSLDTFCPLQTSKYLSLFALFPNVRSLHGLAQSHYKWRFQVLDHVTSSWKLSLSPFLYPHLPEMSSPLYSHKPMCSSLQMNTESHRNWAFLKNTWKYLGSFYFSVLHFLGHV